MRISTIIISASLLLLPLWGGSGCGDDPITHPTDTGGDATDTVEPPTVVLTLHLTDFVSQADLSGLAVTIGDATGTTGDDGTVALTVAADADVVIDVTGPGTRPHLFYIHTGADDASLAYPLAADPTISAFEAILQLTIDDARGILEIAAVDADTGAPIPDLTIATDAAADVALVYDPTSQTGLSAGNTTVAGAPSAAIFVNIAAGSVTPTFTHLWGWTCTGPAALDVPAGSHVLAEYACTYTPVRQDVKLTDFVSGEVVPGATVSVLGQTLTSDAQGLVAYDAPPNADVALTVTGTGFRDHVIYRRTADHQALETYPLATDTTISTLEAALQVTVDDTKGILELTPREAGSRAFIPGLTAELDVTYDVGLVFDAEAATGLSAGTTTLAGSPSTIIFVNAAAGDVTPSFSDAAGNVCSVGPQVVPIAAGSYVIAEYECAVPSE
ncbi:MAG: hypothetical protein CVU56_17100 [Deltaproteobacteria bacterium HGW-Deltaproteobacteria-14]|jgi:hypothetical protein|nr:MAG: hypothetical protein CVU56_17100 [Deltaproteobacteria bacterium HGW-Deltaproteobacteria-14]